MSILNLQINTIAYKDNKPSNNPSIRVFDYSFKLLGMQVDRAKSEDFLLAPGETRSIFNGMRVTTIDGTTAFDISQPDPSISTYRFTNSAGTAPVLRTDRLPGVDNTSQFVVTVNGPLATYNSVSVAQAANYTGQIAGMTTPITLTADVAGTAGNSISLVADGTSSISALITAWNTANPGNTVTLTSGDGTQIPTSGTITLSGGLAGGTLMTTTNVVVGDQFKLEVGSGFNPANCGRFTVLSKTATSVTVQNLNATAESITVADFTKFYLYSAGGTSNQTQVGDKVIISAGFSPSTQGTYDITEVTPKWFEVAVVAPNGLPLETGIMPGATGIIFYSSAKRFVMIAAQQKCSVQNNADASNNSLIEPIEVDNPERPGIYIKQGTTYALSITNLSLEPLSLIVSSAE